MSAITHQRGAFTLIELIAVLVIAGILAATISPVMDSIRRTRDAGFAREIVRRLLLARAHAAATGQPAGVRFTAATQSVSMLRITSGGAAPTPMPSANGGAPAPAADALGALFPGASMTAVSISGPTGDTIWFDYEGTPHLRTTAGAYAGPLAADATITISGGRTITIHAVTGMVE